MNYYTAVNDSIPELRPFLAEFGLDIQGPEQLYPLEPSCYVPVYRVSGRILRRGSERDVGGVPVLVEQAPITDDHGQESFTLTLGPFWLPWVLEEDPDEVLSPANLPEFLDETRKIVLKLMKTKGNLQ
jgi:hypothetical protein